MAHALRNSALFCLFVVALLFGLRVQAQEGSLLPPGGSSAAGGDSGAATSPGFSLPSGMADEEESVSSDSLELFSGMGEEEKSPEEIEGEIYERAFNAALTGLFPMRPAEIRKLLEFYDKTEEAIQKPVYPYPEPELVVQTVSLDPGTKPPVIKLAMGHVTTLAIVDVTGAPWKIFDYAFAGPFEITNASDSNVLRISPTAEFAHGNISLQMLGLNTPVIFTMAAHRDTVHYRFDARIPEYGPEAEAPLIEGGISISAGSSDMGAVLDGVPPSGAEKMDVSGVDGRTSVYRLNNNTYVRTPLTLLSPGWLSSVSSADGMNVYKISEAPVLLLSEKGKMVRARISEKVEDYE